MSCNLPQLGGLACTPETTNTLIGIDGQPQPVKVCDGHYEFLRREITKVPSNIPTPQPSETPKVQQNESPPPVQSYESCKIFGDRDVAWPRVRKILLEEQVPGVPRHGPLSPPFVAIFQAMCLNDETIRERALAP